MESGNNDMALSQDNRCKASKFQVTASVYNISMLISHITVGTPIQKHSTT